MRRFYFVLLAAAALAPPARAAVDPSTIKGADDTRIRTVEYSDKSVIRITSTDLVPVTIIYGETERPTLVAGAKVVVITPKEGADDKATQAAADACTEWCADRHGNELTLQPIKADDGSMLVVTTEEPAEDGDLHAGQCTQAPTSRCIRHHHAYELRTRTGKITDTAPDGTAQATDPEAYFRVVTTYPAEDAARKAAAWRLAHQGDLAAVQHQKVADRLAIAQFSAPRNYQWTHGDSPDCSVLSPQRMSDNGQFTTLYFPMNTPISIPNRVNADKTETRLDWHPEKAPEGGDLMVLHSVPEKFVLRRSNMVCLFVNNAYNKDQKVPTTGTSAPDVVRVTKP